MGQLQDRNDALRPRVRDAVTNMGMGDVDAGMERFVDHSLYVAGKLGLRVWKGDRHTSRRACFYSLMTILGRNAHRASELWKHPTNNNNWVLDVWEAAVDDYFQITQIERPVFEPEPTVDPNQIATAILVGHEWKPLSTRILEAYIARDAETMLEALAELESLKL